MKMVKNIPEMKKVTNLQDQDSNPNKQMFTFSQNSLKEFQERKS